MKTLTIKNSTFEIVDDAARNTITTLSQAVDTLSPLKDTKVDKNTVFSILNKKPSVASLDDFFNLQRTSDIYQTKVYKHAFNHTSTCEK